MMSYKKRIASQYAQCHYDESDSSTFEEDRGIDSDTSLCSTSTDDEDRIESYCKSRSVTSKRQRNLPKIAISTDLKSSVKKEITKEFQVGSVFNHRNLSAINAEDLCEDLFSNEDFDNELQDECNYDTLNGLIGILSCNKDAFFDTVLSMNQESVDSRQQ